MDMEPSYDPKLRNNARSSSGCWTCRLRRKKCDEHFPACNACAELHITCHYEQDKPEWMDGGVKQEEMAERLKREVKEKAHLRHGKRVVHVSSDHPTVNDFVYGGSKASAEGVPENEGIRRYNEASTLWRQPEADHKLMCKDTSYSVALGRSDTVLIMFYLEHVYPFLFPLYQPSLIQGGRAWILEMMLRSPVVRQAALCQSSYFFSLTWGAPNVDTVWEIVLSQTTEAFEVLRQSLQVINSSSVTEHLHGAVRVMSSIMQVQRFEITVLSFKNCQAHLNAALDLFTQLLENAGTAESTPLAPNSAFDAVMSLLGPPSQLFPSQGVQIPTAEQAAFHFSSALLLLDDIVASTVLQEPPRLYEYHQSLLDSDNGFSPTINLEAVIGCQNWAMQQIGEIAMLDAWKQKCQKAGNLNVVELVQRATAIKDSLDAHLVRLETDPIVISEGGTSLLDMLTPACTQKLKALSSRSSLVTRVWAYAALVYLSVVVSGWQPASVDVRCHVDQIIQLLTHQLSPPALLRTMVWPFCVAGCLAQREQESHLRSMVQALRPSSVFGTLSKALEIMENVWRNRSAEDIATRDLASCFRGHGDLVLLV